MNPSTSLPTNVSFFTLKWYNCFSMLSSTSLYSVLQPSLPKKNANRFLKKIVLSRTTEAIRLPSIWDQKSSSSFPSQISGAVGGANLREASLASSVLLLPHQTIGMLENRMNTPLESRLLARRGRSTAFEVYGVEPNTLTRYLLGAGWKIKILEISQSKIG